MTTEYLVNLNNKVVEGLGSSEIDEEIYGLLDKALPEYADDPEASKQIEELEEFEASIETEDFETEDCENSPILQALTNISREDDMTNSINDIIEREDYEGILAQDCWETLVLTVHETNTVTTANAIIKELEKRHMKTVKPAKAGKKTVAAAKKPVKTVGKKETTKPVKTAKPSKKETAKAVVTVKPVKTVKKPDTVTAKTIKKTIKTVKSVSSIPLSKKAKYFNSLKEGLTADFAKYQYNSKTGKNDVKIQVKKRWVVIYSLKNPKYHRNLLNNVRNRGAILAHCEIEKMTVIPKDGLKFDIVKGSDVPGEKQEKTVKKTGEKISEKKTVVNTYRSFPIIVHGLDQLEGLDKTGNVIDETTSNYVVEFHSKKTSVDYQVSFSKKTGLQVEAPERYSWKVNLEEVKTAKKYL